MAVAAVSATNAFEFTSSATSSARRLYVWVDGWPRRGDGGVIGVVGGVRWGASWYRLFEHAELRSPWADPSVPGACHRRSTSFPRTAVGTRLMRSLQERATAKGYDHALDLEVSAVNELALALYRNIGFETLGRPSPSVFWMRLPLDR